MNDIVLAVAAAGQDLEDTADGIDASHGDGGAEAVIEELLSMLQRLILDQERRVKLERADAARMALEMAADTLEAVHTNDLYKRAFNKAAKMLRQ